MIEIMYRRDLAVEYASFWAFDRNPEYYDFQDIGGDCTNFVSQCLYAGCGVMNYTPVYGWYYINANNRSPSWTGVEFLYRFLVNNQSIGPFAEETDISQILPADIVQLGDENGDFYHSLLVLRTGDIPTPENTYIAAHTNDAFMRPLSSYEYANIRFLHILGARIP